MESQGLHALSPGCNLILGKNGSGKSSFLNALIYVLSDRFSGLPKHKKRSMLNSITQQMTTSQQRQRAAKADGASLGAGSGKPPESNTYWVEVTLDNSKHKIPFSAREITLRKSYNCHTDREDYHINGQLIAQKDLFNLFESGNFPLQS